MHELDRRRVAHQRVVRIGGRFDRPGPVHRVDRTAGAPRRAAPRAPCPRSSRRGRAARSVRRRRTPRSPTSRTGAPRAARSTRRRCRRPTARSNAARSSTTRSAKWVGTSSTTRSSPGKRHGTNLPDREPPGMPRCSPAMDRKTVDVYERTCRRVDRAAAAPGAAERGLRSSPGPRQACGPTSAAGPGWYSGLLGEPVVALDAAFAMVGTRPRVRAGGAARPGRPRTPAVPTRRARRCVGAQVVHARARRERVPMALAELHRARACSAARSTSRSRAIKLDAGADDPFAGRHFSHFSDRRTSARSSRARASTCCRAATTARSGSTSRRPRARMLARHGRRRHAGADRRAEPERPLGRRGRRLRASRQPVLAGRARRGTREPRRSIRSTRCASRRRRHDQPRAARDRPRADELTVAEYRRRRRPPRTPRALAATGRGVLRSASPATAPRSTKPRNSGWQASASRRRAGLRHAEPERAERAREARRLRRALRAVQRTAARREHARLELARLLLERRRARRGTTR